MSGAVRAAIVGPGAIAGTHAWALRAAGADLVGVAGTTKVKATAFAQEHEIRVAWGDPDEALTSPDVDMVVISSPHDAHVPQAARALAAGKHVLVEVPMALSSEDGEYLVDLAARHGVLLGVCQTLRFHESVAAARSVVTGSPAPPSLISARRLMHRVSDVGWTGRRRSWTDNLLWHHGGHVIDCLRFITAEDVTVVGAVAGPRLGDTGSPLDYAASLVTTSGTAVSVTLSYTSLEDVNDVVVCLDGGTLVVSPSSLRHARGEVTAQDPVTTLDDATARQDAAFIEALRGGPAFAAEGGDVLRTLRALDGIERATRAV